MKFHKLSEMFPLMEGEEFDQLVQDIRVHGQIEQITLYNGEILDGRNRYRACLEVKREPAFWRFEGTEKEAHDFVVSQNLHRRHLTRAARNEFIKRAVTENPSVPNTKLAKQLNIDRDTVADARKTMEKNAEIPHSPRTHRRKAVAFGPDSQPRSSTPAEKLLEQNVSGEADRFTIARAQVLLTKISEKLFLYLPEDLAWLRGACSDTITEIDKFLVKDKKITRLPFKGSTHT